MTLAEFVARNRDELKRQIRDTIDLPNFPLDDDDLETWVENVEELYLWAKREGAEV